MLLFFLMSLFTSNTVATNCDYNFNFSNTFIDWSKSDNIIPISISLQRGRARNCNKYFITFSKGTANSYDRKLSHSYSGHLLYNLYSDPSATKVLKDKNDISNSNDYLDGHFHHSQAESTFYAKLLVPNNTSTPLIRGGLYQDSVVVSLYSNKPNQSHSLQDSRTYIIQTYVPKMVDISLVDVGAPFDINDTSQTLDFGSLTTGDEKSFDLRVQANAGYAIYFESQNKGKMKNESGESINYTMKIDNISKNLSASTSNVASGVGVTPAGGRAHRVSIVIGNVNEKKYGQYTDYITVTAMTTE